MPDNDKKSVAAKGWEEVEKCARLVKEKVKIATKPDVKVKLRKTVNFSLVRATFGTDFKMKQADAGAWTVDYKPNFVFRVKDNFLDGDFGFDTDNKTISYSKDLYVENIKVGVDAAYCIDNNTPYIGFRVFTTPGFSSSAKHNGISINKEFKRVIDYPEVNVDVQGYVDLPQAEIDTSNASMKYGTFDVNLRRVKVETVF